MTSVRADVNNRQLKKQRQRQRHKRQGCVHTPTHNTATATATAKTVQSELFLLRNVRVSIL